MGYVDVLLRRHPRRRCPGHPGLSALMSQALYEGLGPTAANVLVGVLSAVVDNVPVMFAVLSMNPAMSEGQWLLVTLTAGVAARCCRSAAPLVSP